MEVFEKKDLNLAVDEDSRLSDGVSAQNDAEAADGLNKYVVTEQMRQEARAPHDAEVRMYERALKALEEPETKEQREKRLRKEKSRRLIAAIGDGLSALSNLYFTTKYAPNMYEHEKMSQASAVERGIERARQLRKDNDRAFLEYSLGAAKAKADGAGAVRQLEAQMEARQQAAAKAKALKEQEERATQLFPLQKQEQQAKTYLAEFKAEYQRLLNEGYPEKHAAEIAEKEARMKNYEAQTANSYASANEHNVKAANEANKTETGTFRVEDADGNMVIVSAADLHDYYQQSDVEIRRRHQQTDSYGSVKTPTIQEMKQVVTEHLNRHGNTYRKPKEDMGKGAGYGGGSSSTKQGKGAGYGNK